jgi:hypothetical protein
MRSTWRAATEATGLRNGVPMLLDGRLIAIDPSPLKNFGRAYCACDNSTSSQPTEQSTTAEQRRIRKSPHPPWLGSAHGHLQTRNRHINIGRDTGNSHNIPELHPIAVIRLRGWLVLTRCRRSRVAAIEHPNSAAYTGRRPQIAGQDHESKAPNPPSGHTATRPPSTWIMAPFT